MMQGEIVITQTKNEYLLAISAAQKERAKGIENRRWDPQRKRWVYPRSARIYSALVAEFGDDLTQSSLFTPPESLRELVKPKKEERERAELQGDARRIDQTLSNLLETFSNFLKDTDDDRANMLMNKESEIRSLEAEIRKKDSENLALERQCSQFQEEIASLENRIKRIEGENGRLRDENRTPSTNKYELIKSMAMDGVGTDPVFGDAMRKLPINDQLPVEVCGLIERYLKRLLKSDDSLYNLIDQCRDAELLDDDAIGLAHVIRKQRNFILHHKDADYEDERARLARSIFCLFGSIILLPKLPELSEERA